MKFHRENTCLHFLTEPVTLASFRVSADSKHDEYYARKFGISVVSGFDDVKDAYAKNIRFITQPFWEAYQKSKHKFASIFDKETINESGTFLIKAVDHAGPGEVNTIFYYINSGVKDGAWYCDYCIMFFSSRKDKDKPVLNIFVSGIGDIERDYISKTAYNSGYTDGTAFLADLITLLLFLKYCDLETKIIKPGKIEKHVGEKYFNDNKMPIKILNSTWFTTIVRSEGFGVTGHFRFQPYGPGMTQKKLIYIEPFQKYGYIRKATVLNQTT